MRPSLNSIAGPDGTRPAPVSAVEVIKDTIQRSNGCDPAINILLNWIDDHKALQKPKQSVVLARLRGAIHGLVSMIGLASANSAACPKFQSAEGTPRQEAREAHELGSKEKLTGKAERLSQKPVCECGIASPALVQQKGMATPKSDYAPQSPIMFGATNFEPDGGSRPTQAPVTVHRSVLARLFPRPSMNLLRGNLAHTSRASETNPLQTSLALSSRHMADARRRMLVRLLVIHGEIRRVA